MRWKAAHPRRPLYLFSPLALAAVGTPAIVLLAMTCGHLIAGTPAVVATLLPSWISGSIFSVVYTLNLRRLERGEKASAPPPS